MSQSKKYIVEIMADKGSLENFKKQLQAATDVKDGVEIPALSRESKAQIKKDIATMFGVAEHQAEALQKMMQAVADGFADNKSVETMKKELEDTLTFVNTIMNNMQKMGDATSWMDRGVTFVDDFIKMKDSLGSIKEVESSLRSLEKTFGKFKDALAETNTDAFLQRFGTSTRNDAKEYAAAQKELQRIAKNRTKAIKEILLGPANDDGVDYSKKSKQEIEKIYRGQMDAIIDCNNEIQELRKKYKGNTAGLYNDTDYQDAIRDIVEANRVLENLHGLGDGIGSDLRASMQIATDSVREAGNEIQNLVNKLKDKGIELAITLPDATSQKFAAEINKFVEKASEEFKDHPIEMTLDVVSPFKKDAFKKNGTLKELSDKQKELSKNVEDTFRENLKTEEIEIGEDDLKGLYNVNTNVIARNITDAFNKLYKSMTAGQALITSATRKWREKIEEDLTVTPKFQTDVAKKMITDAIEDIETDLQGGEHEVTIYPNTEQLVAEIQSALKEDKFAIDVKVDNVDTSGVVLNVASAQIMPGGYVNVGSAPMHFEPQNVHPDQPALASNQSQQPVASKSSSVAQTVQQNNTSTLMQNSEAVIEGTITQRILTDAVNDLSQSLSTIDGRMQSVQDRISSVEKQRAKNAKEIESSDANADIHKKRRDIATENVQSAKQQLQDKKEERESLTQLIDKIRLEVRNAAKSENMEAFDSRMQHIIEKLPSKASLEAEIEAVKASSMNESSKDTEITKLKGYINAIKKITNPDIDLTKDTDDAGTKLYYTAITLAYREALSKLDKEISKLESEVESRQRAYTNADTAMMHAKQKTQELSGEDTEENAERQLKKLKDEKGTLASRKKKIQKVLDNDEDPVTLVLNEVSDYWKTSDKKINDAEKYIAQSEVKLKKLEKELEEYEDKDSSDYKKKQKEYDEENARLYKDKKYVQSKNAIVKWTESNAAMRAAGLDLKTMKPGNEIEEIIGVLVANATLADSLLNNKSLKGLSSIQNLGYFIPKVQQTMGADSRAYEDYMSEQELRANFLEALKINEYIVAARSMLKAGDTDISPVDVQNFIDYFENIPEMTEAVNIARQYLSEVSKLPQDTWDDDVESYFDQFKNIWDSLDKDSKSVFLDAYSNSKRANGIKVTDVQNMDDKWFARILDAFNEGESPLKGLETDSKQIQQILGILQRSILLSATKDLANQYGEHGILASLFGMQKSNLMGNKYAPKEPIYITTYDDKNNEKVYELGANGRTQSSDGKFNFTPESFDRMVKKTGTSSEMSDILSLMFDAVVRQNEQLEHKIKNLRSDLNTLKSLDFSDDEKSAESKKKMRRMSYNALDGVNLDGTDVERRWHRYKTLQGEISTIRGALRDGLDNVVLPDVLWKNIKGLRKQRGLEKELRGLNDGELSDDIKKQLKGLTDKEKEKKLQEIKTSKKSELDALKQQNVKDVTKFLLQKAAEYLNLENKIIEQSSEIIAAKEQELDAAEQKHKKNAPLVAQRKREAEDILQQMSETGKFKLSHGKGSVVPKWEQDYEYEDSELAKFENRKKLNDATIKSLKQQNEEDGKLLELLNSNKTNDKINEMLNALSDEDKKKPQDAQLELVKNKVVSAMEHRNAEIARLENVEISLKDVIDSIIALEDDIERGKAKEQHETNLSKADRKRSKRVLNSNKRQYNSKRSQYETALYREASQFDFNNHIKTSRKGSTQTDQLEFSNLLSKIKLANEWEIFDVTKINEIAEEYLTLIAQVDIMADDENTSKEDIKAITDKIRQVQKNLIKEWFSTDSWYLVDMLENQFSVIDGELKGEEQKIIDDAASAKETKKATESAFAEQKKNATQLVGQYIENLKKQYIDGPKEEILDALNKEVRGINADELNVKAELEAVESRADKALQKQREELVEQYRANPLYKQLLEQRSKILNSKEYSNKDVNSNEYKTAHKQVEDINKAMAEIENEYTQKFKEIRNQWIEAEKEKIRKSAATDSYSKNAYKLKEAYDKRDADLSTVHKRAQQDSGILALREQVAKELQADKEYIALTQKYSQMSKVEQGSEQGKQIESKIKSIKQKYDQKVTDAINIWKSAEVERIQKEFNQTVSNLVNGILRNKRSGIRNDNLSTLQEQKQGVIDRLMQTNSEFANIVTSVAEDLKAQLGENPDVFQLSKGLVERGLPKDIGLDDAFVLSVDKIETGEQYKAYFKRIQDALFNQVDKMLQTMLDSVDDTELVSEEEIQAQLEAKREAAAKKKREKVAEVKGKTSRELLSDHYDETSDRHLGKALGIKKDRETLESKRDRIMRDYGKSHGVTPEMVAAARKGTLIVKVNAKKVETTSQEPPKIEKTTSSVTPQKQTTTTSTPKQQYTMQPMQAPKGGLVYGAYGYVPAIIDTSDLAKEGTLRGLYELFNGGAPKGGWDDSVSESSKVHDNQRTTPLDNESDEVAGSAQKFVSSLQSIIDSAATRKTEMAALIGENGQLGARIQGTKNGVNANHISKALAEQVKEQVLAVLHNHPSGSATLSTNDLQAAYNRAYSKGSYVSNKPVKISGSVANGKITTVDFSDIDEDTASKIVAEYKKQRDALVDATEEDIYNTLVNVFTQAGHSGAVQQVDTSRLDEWRNSIIAKAQQQVTESIVESGTQTAVEAISGVTTTDVDITTTEADSIVENIPSDILSIYRTAFSKFAFKDELGNRLNEFVGKCRDYIEMQFESGELVDDDIGELFKVGENDELTIASEDLYKVKAIRDKIIGILLDSIEENFYIHGLDKIYDDNKSNIKQTLENILPYAQQPTGKDTKKTTKKKEPIKKEEQPTQAPAPSNKDVENANAISDAAERRANAEADAAESARKRADAVSETAAAEDKIERETTKDTRGQTTSGSTSRDRPSYEHNYTKGLAGLAQESTLQSILAQLSSGIKVTSDKSGGDKKGGKKKKDETPLNLTAGDAWATAQEYIQKNYPDFTNLSALKPVSGGYSIDVFRPNNLEEYAAAQKRVNDLIAAGKQETEEFSQAQLELNKLKYDQEKVTLKIGELDGKIQVTQDKSGFQNLALGVKAAAKELQTVEGVLTQLHEVGALSFDVEGSPISSNLSIQKYIDNLKELESYRNKLSPDQLFDPVVNQNLSTLTLSLQNSRKEVMALANDIAKLNIGEKINTDMLANGIAGLSDSEIKQVMKDIVSSSTEMETKFKDASRVTNEFGEVIGYQLAYTVRTGKHEIQEMTAVLNPLTNELRVQKGAIKDAESGWKAFVQGLKGKAASIMQYLMSITSIHDIFRYFSNGIQSVRDIDSALTELKKVTNETDASYASFLKNMSKTGGTIGATVTDLTTMAADWARLGYSMQEAGKLAESTAILLNVSEFQDANQASEALISTMQAFQYTADESQHVVDILNEVGNNYAVSSDGIATALQDSASALMEAGNNLEQSVALVAAANKVVQDPNSVGSALRTISLRLRGTSVSVLEELGEETDGAVESVSKMQEKIEALTGVNILTDTGAYKDTYTILQEIGTVWENMSDIDQAKCCLYVQKCA